jgi:hypothetical protein
MRVGIRRRTVTRAAALGVLGCLGSFAGTAVASAGSNSSVLETGAKVHIQAAGTAGVATIDVFRGVRVTTSGGRVTIFAGTQVCISDSVAPPPGDLFETETGCSKVPAEHFALIGIPPSAATLTSSVVVLQPQCTSQHFKTTPCGPSRPHTVSIRLTKMQYAGPVKYNDKDVEGNCTYVNAADQLQYFNTDSNSSTNPYVVFDGQVLDSSYEENAGLSIGSDFTSTRCTR